MLDCENCHGLKCIVVCKLAILAILTLYGSVLALLGGTIIFVSTARGLSENTGVIIAVVFLAVELALFLFSKITPGALVTIVVFGPLLRWILLQAPYKPISKPGDHVIRKAFLARNAIALACSIAL